MTTSTKISIVTLVFNDALREFVHTAQEVFGEDLRAIFRGTVDDMDKMLWCQRRVRDYIYRNKHKLTFDDKTGLGRTHRPDQLKAVYSARDKPDIFALFVCIISDIDAHDNYTSCIAVIKDAFDVNCEFGHQYDDEDTEVRTCCCSQPCGQPGLSKMKNPALGFGSIIGWVCAEKHKIINKHQLAAHQSRVRKTTKSVKTKLTKVKNFQLRRIFAAWKSEVVKTKRQRILNEAKECAQMKLYDIRGKNPIKKDDDTISEMTDDETDDTINVTTNEKVDNGITNPTHELGFISCQLCSSTMRAYKDFTTCFKCNQRKKGAKCVGCNAAFDDKGGLYNKCYNCSNNDKCDKCNNRFNNGGGKYTTCYKCKCSGMCRVCNQKFDDKNGKYTKCYNC